MEIVSFLVLQISKPGFRIESRRFLVIQISKPGFRILVAAELLNLGSRFCSLRFTKLYF